MKTQAFTDTLTVLSCSNCSLPFGISKHFETQRRRDHESFYCPRGHSQYFPGKSDVELAEERAAAAERQTKFARARATAAQDQAEAHRRTSIALKGHLTRARNKIANGVCPVAGCKRHFDNVQNHIARMHPDWHLTDPETGMAVKP
jgi:hypothetical protein